MPSLPIRPPFGTLNPFRRLLVVDADDTGRALRCDVNGDVHLLQIRFVRLWEDSILHLGL